MTALNPNPFGFVSILAVVGMVMQGKKTWFVVVVRESAERNIAKITK
jgi:hypothetical protein